MRARTERLVFATALGLLLVAAGAARAAAQETQANGLKGNAAAGKKAYRRYCIGCHGPEGDGNGENAQWIDPKPRDFTAAVFKCRSRTSTTRSPGVS
jgi:mono/diheme cytochrome c family protein